MAYNLEAFERFVIAVPPTHRVVALIGGLSFVAALLSTGVLAVTGEGTLLTGLILFGTFAGGALVGAESTRLLVPSYPRNWAYFLGGICLVLAGVLVPVALLVDSTTTIWFALGTAFLFSFQTLIISDGFPRFPLQATASAVQPTIIFAGLTLTPVLTLSTAQLPYVAVVVGVGAALVLVSWFVGWLLRANVSEVGALEITAHLVQRKELHLGMGEEIDVPVQTFAVETTAGKTAVVAPWIHPGILEGVGGGRLTTNLLNALTDAGKRAFFWHIPSTHLSDSADPRVHEPVLDAVTDPETVDEASQLISRTYGKTTFHGRRYGEKRVIFFESEEYADIEVDIFGEIIDSEETLVVDRHARVEESGRFQVHQESPHAEVLREYLRRFIAELDEQPLAPYRAGDALSIASDGISLYALVEEVDGQRTVCLTADQNERPYALAAVEAELGDEYDEFLIFTTDTHASVYANRFDPQADTERMQALIEEATDRIGPASVGLAAEDATATLLRKDYHRLIFSLNILARVYIVSLAGLYLLLAVGLGLL